MNSFRYLLFLCEDGSLLLDGQCCGLFVRLFDFQLSVVSLAFLASFLSVGSSLLQLSSESLNDSLISLVVTSMFMNFFNGLEFSNTLRLMLQASLLLKLGMRGL